MTFERRRGSRFEKVFKGMWAGWSWDNGVFLMGNVDVFDRI